MYVPNIGDVIQYNGRNMVVIDRVIKENLGDCSYNRKYLLCDYKYLEENQGIVSKETLESHGTWYHITGTNFPIITRVTDMAPFEIETVECKKIRQMTPRNITVYE